MTTASRSDALPPRFWAKVTTDAAGCWVWTGCKTTDGYGTVRLNCKMWRVHRLTYTTFVGPIPTGLTIDHLCRNRACCNPEHLEAVTNRTNGLRGNSVQAMRLAQTACIHGHPFTPENTYITPRGHRQCRTCGRRLTALNKAKRRQSG